MSCFCCQKEIGKDKITYQIEDFTLTLCSEECLQETKEYFRKARVCNFASATFVWMLLNFVYLYIDMAMTLPFSTSVGRAGLFILFGLYLLVHPYGHRNMSVKLGIRKSKMVLRIVGMVFVVGSILFLLGPLNK